MRIILALVVAIGAIVAGSATAGANPPPPECQGNPHFCHGGDSIVVTVEPPGENCEFGGIKIVVTHPGDEPELARTGDEPTPEPTTETFFVCNGSDGAPGEPGEPGIPGEPGVPGGTVIGPGGLPITVSQTVNVDVNVNGGGRRCHFARAPRLILPARMRGESSVRVRVDRHRASSALVRNGRSIKVRGMRGAKCGPHVVTVRKRGITPTVRLWTVLSRTQLNRRVLIP